MLLPGTDDATRYAKELFRANEIARRQMALACDERRPMAECQLFSRKFVTASKRAVQADLKTFRKIGAPAISDSFSLIGSEPTYFWGSHPPGA